MKWLTYKCKTTIPSVDENGKPFEKEILRTKMVKDNEEGRALAAREAVGEITERDDGKTVIPTDKERLEALESAMRGVLGLDDDGSFLTRQIQMGKVERDQVPSKFKDAVTNLLSKWGV